MASDPPAPPPTLRTVALGAIAAVVCPDGRAEGPPAEIAYLLDHLAACLAGRAPMPLLAALAEALSAALDDPAPADRALVALADALHLSSLEQLAVALAASVEEDPMAGRALAHVQAPLAGSRPSIALVTQAFAFSLPAKLDARGPSSAMRALLAGQAVATGLLTLSSDAAPTPERLVSLPPHLGFALAGHDGSFAGVSLEPDGRGEVPLPASILAEAGRRAASLLASSGALLVLRSPSAADGRAVARAIAASMQRRAAFIETDAVIGLAPWLLLRGLVPVFCVELGPGERKRLPALAGYRGPMLCVAGPDGAVEARGRDAVRWSVPVPPRDERELLWRAALGSDGALPEALAREHRHASGRIAELGRLVRLRASSSAAPTRDDVLAAARSGEGLGLDGLAEPLDEPIPDEALVTTPAIRRELDALLLRCRMRDGLAEGLGASASTRYRPGVRALLVGPSGTGKTLVAGWLATQLGLPLYRVDLASVTSKYIGETEKNLSQLLARAEHAEVVLLFDEADSLFGKRTEVRDANDRFANAQTNYLLQRIESFDGITLLTSNSRTRFDAAFSRRLDVILELPLPGPEERRRIWQSHLGDGHALSQRTLNQLAALIDVGGGTIRNVVLSAAVQARAEARPIELADLLAGLAGEYRKMGKQVPVELRA